MFIQPFVNMGVLEVGMSETETEIDRIAEEIAVLAANLHAGVHRLLQRIRLFDRKKGWFQQGALSCAHWMSWRIGIDLATAREQVRVANALGDLPLVDEALRTCDISYSKARAITRVATAENQSKLLDFARHSTASQMETICRKFRTVLPPPVPANLRKRLDHLRFVRRRVLDESYVQIEARLPADEAALLLAAIDKAKVALGRERPPSDGDCAIARAAASRADGLVAIAESFMAGGTLAARTVTCEVMVHVDAEALAANGPGVLEDGTPVSAETLRRVVCDGALVKVIDGADGKPLDVGRKTRAIPSAIRRALRLRDGGCRYPGCTRTAMLQAHHVRHWADGGETCLSNLCHLCRYHHWIVHEGGFSVASAPGGRFVFRDQRGWEILDAPLPDPGGSVERLFESNRAAGLAIDSETGRTRWDGQRADHALCIDALVDSTRKRESPPEP